MIFLLSRKPRKFSFLSSSLAHCSAVFLFQFLPGARIFHSSYSTTPQPNLVDSVKPANEQVFEAVREGGIFAKKFIFFDPILLRTALDNDYEVDLPSVPLYIREPGFYASQRDQDIALWPLQIDLDHFASINYLNVTAFKDLVTYFFEPRKQDYHSLKNLYVSEKFSSTVSASSRYSPFSSSSAYGFSGSSSNLEIGVWDHPGMRIRYNCTGKDTELGAFMSILEKVAEQFRFAISPEHLVSSLLAQSFRSVLTPGNLSFMVASIDNYTIFLRYWAYYGQVQSYADLDRAWEWCPDWTPQEKLDFYDRLLEQLPLETLWQLLLKVGEERSASVPSWLWNTISWRSRGRGYTYTSEYFACQHSTLLLNTISPSSVLSNTAIITFFPSIYQEVPLFFCDLIGSLAVHALIRPVRSSQSFDEKTFMEDYLITTPDFRVAPSSELFDLSRIGLIVDWLQVRLRVYNEMLLSTGCVQNSPLQKLNNWFLDPEDPRRSLPFLNTHYPLVVEKFRPFSWKHKLGLI